MSNPLPMPQQPMRDLQIDHSHISNHFMQGQFDAPITQKIRFGGKSIRLDTPVDGQGNVGESTFR
jgi:hypothetical protein